LANKKTGIIHILQFTISFIKAKCDTELESTIFDFNKSEKNTKM